MKWFKKKALVKNTTSRLYDIYGEGYNFRYLEDKVDVTAKQLNDKIDANVADLQPLEKKVADNTTNILTNIRNIQQHGTLLNEHTTKINKISNDLSNANLANYRGVYDGAVTYKLGDLVSNNTDNNVYLSVKNSNRNHNLTDTTWWKIITFSVDTSDFVKTNVSNTFTEEQIIKGKKLTFNTSNGLPTMSLFPTSDGGIIQGLSGELTLKGNKLKLDCGNISVNSNRISDVANPAYNYDAANKIYVDERVNSSVYATPDSKRINLDIDVDYKWYTSGDIRCFDFTVSRKEINYKTPASLVNGAYIIFHYGYIEMYNGAGKIPVVLTSIKPPTFNYSVIRLQELGFQVGRNLTPTYLVLEKHIIVRGN